MLREKWKRACAWINQVEHYTPDAFVKSQWQLGEASTLYLLYRWTVAVVFVCGILASWIDLGRNPRRGQTTSHYLKWPIYLTNWGFTLCTLQAILSTVHVTKHYAKVRRNRTLIQLILYYQKKVEIEKMKTSYKIYWILHSVAAIGAIVISTVYWAAVYNPKKHRLDIVNLKVHLLNSVLMVLDLWIVAHPFKLLHGYYWIILGFFYTTFTYMYFILGGTGSKGQVYIYRILDWRKPANALLAIGGTIAFGAAVAVLVWVMSMFKRRLGNLFHQKMTARRTENTSQGTANQGRRASPSQGTANQGRRASTSQGTANQGRRASPSQGTANQGRRASTSQGTANQGRSESPSQGTANQGRRASRSQGTANQGGRASPSQGTANQGRTANSSQSTPNQGRMANTSQGTSNEGRRASTSQGTRASPSQGTANQGRRASRSQGTANQGRRENTSQGTANKGPRIV